MVSVSWSSQSQAACEGRGAGSRDGPRWDVPSPTAWSPGDQRHRQSGAGCGVHQQSNTASDEPGLGRVWVPGEASWGQEGVLVPREKVHGLFKLSEGNSNSWEKRR